MTEAHVIEARAIGYRYGDRRALDGLDLQVEEGAIFGLLGPNGSGKSTFISLVAGAEAPPEGELRMFGQAPARTLRARIGTVFQESALDPDMTLAETLWLAGRMYGMGGDAIHARSAELLGAFGLGDRAGDRAGTLSGGMRRRLEVARALLHDPDLLVLDEPTTGIDAAERRAIWDVLLDRERTRRTVLLATNDLVEADTVCERAAFLRDGRVIACGSPADLKRGLRRDAIRAEWHGVGEPEIARVQAIPGVGTVSVEGDVVLVVADDASLVAPRLFELAGRDLRSVELHPATLEDAYLQLLATSHARRAEEATPV